MTFNWRSYIDALSANVQRVYSKNGASRGSNLTETFSTGKIECLVEEPPQAAVHGFRGSVN
jgi:hypothetical protein